MRSDSQCYVDSVMTPCSTVFRALGNGSAAQCPNNDCGPRSVVYQGQGTWAFFNAHADGYQGYMPIGATYTGNGNFSPRGPGPPSLRKKSRPDTNFSLLNGATDEAQLGRTSQTFFHHPQNQGLDDLIRRRQLDYVFQVANSILSQNNPCSDFFGGIQSATTILGVLRSSLDFGALANSPNTGISMNLPPPVAGNLHPAGNGFSYRVPNSATLNTNGIFYHVVPMNEYISNSLAGQLAQIFHEEAHLTVTSAGNSRIPNDGFSGLVSRQNTSTVLGACRTSINAAVANPPPMPPLRPLIP